MHVECTFVCLPSCIVTQHDLTTLPPPHTHTLILSLADAGWSEEEWLPRCGCDQPLCVMEQCTQVCQPGSVSLPPTYGGPSTDLKGGCRDLDGTECGMPAYLSVHAVHYLCL